MYRVQEVSVDGSHIHPEDYVNLAEAVDVAEGIMERASGHLRQVKVMDDRQIDWRLVKRWARG